MLDRGQRQFFLELLRFVVINTGNPGKLPGAELAGAHGNRLCQQRVLPAIGKVGEPAENPTLIHAIRRCDALHRLPLTHRFDSLLLPHLQGVMVERTAVEPSFAFHKLYYRSLDTTYGNGNKCT